MACGADKTTRGAAATLTGIPALLLALLLAGCGAPAADTPYTTYLSRLANTLPADADEPLPPPAPRMPRGRDLRLDLEGSDIDALDFLALSGCALQVTIGKRNSSLGRMAAPSQRLLLELEYLRLAPACIDKLRGEERTALADTLANAWEAKREQLPALVFNATLASDEFRGFWSPSQPPGGYPAVGDDRAGAALAAIDQQVGRWLAGDYSADGTGFEIQLSEVAGGEGGALLKDLLRQQAFLAVADAMIDARMAKGPLCAPGIRHRAADILPNVVRRYFIEGIQPRAARMDSRRYSLFPPLVALENRIAAALPAAYRDWAQARDAALADAAAAPRRHVEHLQAIQAPCKGPAPAATP
jgi:hypothetical protein